MSIEAILIATIPSMLAVLSAIVTVRLSTRGQGKEREASASEKNVDAAIKLVAALQIEVDDLKRNIASMDAELSRQHLEMMKLRRRVRVLSNYANALIMQIRDIGIEPVVAIEEIEKVLQNGD